MHVTYNMQSNSSTMNEIHAHDVLFGRGKGIYLHEGNVVFRNLIKTYKVIAASIAPSHLTDFEDLHVRVNMHPARRVKKRT